MFLDPEEEQSGMMTIHGELFDTDYDDVGYEPEEVESDSDKEMEERFGFDN